MEKKMIKKICKKDTKGLDYIIKYFREPDKTYFYLRYFMYYKIDEIAQRYKTTRASVENRLYRCRLKLKEALEGGKVNEG